MSDSITIIERLLLSSNARHRTLASNIANVDTPGYQAKDVRFGEALNSEMAVMKTHPGHQGAGVQGAPAGVVTLETPSWQDRNNVELDQEVAKMTENAMLYQAGVNMLQTRIRMYKNALRTR